MPIPPRHCWAAFFISSSAAFSMCGYELLRSSANTLFKSTYGVSNLPAAMACIPVVIVIMLFVYGRTLSWLGPRKTLFASMLASAAVMLACYAAFQTNLGIAAFLLFIFHEAYVVLIIEQYWSFLDSTLNQASAHALNGPIIGFASLGSIAGGLLLHHFAESLGTVTMLLFAAVTMLPAALLADRAYSTCHEPSPTPAELSKRRGHLGLSHFRNSPLLFLLFIVIATQILATVLSLRFQEMLQLEIPNPDQQTAFSGGYFAALNGAAAFMQFIATPILLRFVPLFLINAVIPLIHFATWLNLVSAPSLTTSLVAYMVFKCLDYSLFKAAKETLYIPLSFDVRYRTKEVIDAFGYRFGKGGTSFLIFLLRKLGMMTSMVYACASLGAIALWFLFVFPLMASYRASPHHHDAAS